MNAKRIVLRPLAEQDVEAVLRCYRHEGGTSLSSRWAEAFERALRHIGKHPATGLPRHADMLDISGLRFLPVKAFPYLVFYVERVTDVDVWRALHGVSDIPQWLGEDGEKS